MGKKRKHGVTIGDTYYPHWEDAARAFNLSPSTLKYRIKRELPLDAPLHVTRSNHDTRKPYLFTKLPEVVQAWILNSIPKEVTISDYITAIIIDAYNDDGEPYGPITDNSDAAEEP